MSARPGFVVDERVRANEGEPPNNYVGQISAQVRCNWPPTATEYEVRTVLFNAYRKALAELDTHERKPKA